MVQPTRVEAGPRERFRITANLRGALWMLLSAVTFTAMTSLVKFLAADYPPTLQAFYRNLAGFLVLLPWILRNPSRAFATSRPGILIFRASAGTLGLILQFYAFQAMPLAEANALSFTRALWLVPIAALVLGETIGPHRIGAALIGFAGVLVMLHMGVHGVAVGLPQLAALASALLFALTVAGMKTLTRDHRPSTLLYWSAALGLLFTFPLAFVSWRTPTLRDLALLGLMGVLATVNQLTYIKGMQSADAAAMAPIDYTRLVFAAGVGFFVFNELPGVNTVIGAAIVIAATLYITFREHALAVKAERALEAAGL